MTRHHSLDYSCRCFLPLWESQNVLTYFHRFRIFMTYNKPGTFVVPNPISQDTGSEFIKTHKTQTVPGKPGRMGSVFTYHQTQYSEIIYSPYRMYCCWITAQTAIISSYSNDWLFCITETECVYCAVRTQSLNKFMLIFVLNGLSSVSVVARQMTAKRNRHCRM